MERIDYLGRRIGRWQVGNSTFLAFPESGARLMNWHLRLADGSFRDIIHWPEMESLDGIAQARGGNPILFPFSARTFHQGTIHQWKDPDGTVRPMPMHGIARQGRFALSRADEHGFTAVFEPDAETAEAYPFDYEFTVAYRFQELALSVEFRLKNLGSRRLPWSAGHHFYFAIPWRDGGHRKDYRIRVPARKAWRQNTRGLLEPVPDHHPGPETLDAPGLIDRIHTDLTSDRVTVKDTETGSRLRLKIGSQAKPTREMTVVTWTGGPEVPYYCVEPWMGPPNSPETGLGLHWVEPGCTGVFSVEVFID
ncbi:MAG: aldose epimerase [Opitutaceae bacterium]